MILRHFILKFVWKQTENDYNLTVKCCKRRNYHTLQSKILPFKVWLNSTLTVVQLCYPPLKIHFLLSGNTLLFFVIPNTLLTMRGVCYCSKKAVKKSSLSPEVENEMSFEHFFPCPSITQPLVNRYSDETGLSWSNILRFFPTLCSILIYTVLCSDMVARFVNNLQGRRYKTCLNLILIVLIL